MPDDEAARNFPFARPPPQSPLGEACRCGFKEMGKVRLWVVAAVGNARAAGGVPRRETARRRRARDRVVWRSGGDGMDLDSRAAALFTSAPRTHPHTHARTQTRSSTHTRAHTRSNVHETRAHDVLTLRARTPPLVPRWLTRSPTAADRP